MERDTKNEGPCRSLAAAAGPSGGRGLAAPPSSRLDRYDRARLVGEPEAVPDALRAPVGSLAISGGPPREAPCGATPDSPRAGTPRTCVRDDRPQLRVKPSSSLAAQSSVLSIASPLA